MISAAAEGPDPPSCTVTPPFAQCTADGIPDVGVRPCPPQQECLAPMYVTARCERWTVTLYADPLVLRSAAGSGHCVLDPGPTG